MNDVIEKAKKRLEEAKALLDEGNNIDIDNVLADIDYWKAYLKGAMDMQKCSCKCDKEECEKDIEEHSQD